jgi:SAM-dependent methyltransferase
MDQTGGYQEYDFVSEFYDHVVPYRNRSDVAFYVEMAKTSPGPVLEIGCGTGRILIATAQAGNSVVGMDLSKRMLDILRQRLAEEPEDVRTRVRLVEGDMRDFDLGEHFGLITLPFRPFQHLLTVEDQMASLRSIRRHLRPDGRLVLDFFNPSLPNLVNDKFLNEETAEPEFTLADGRRVVRKHRTVKRDYFNQINDIEFIYYVMHPNGSEDRLVHRFQMRYLFRFEVEHLLARCGFDVEAIYSDYLQNPYGSVYPGDLVVVARLSAG